MPRLITALSFCLALVGCAGRAPLAEASGPYRALNPGRWQPTAEDLSGVRAPLPPEARK